MQAIGLKTDKRCPNCGETKPTGEFYHYVLKTGKERRSSYCKLCTPKVNAATTARWQKAHPDRLNAAARRWQAKNPYYAKEYYEQKKKEREQEFIGPPSLSAEEMRHLRLTTPKQCAMCGEIKPATCFTKLKARGVYTHLCSYCRPCMAARVSVYQVSTRKRNAA